MKAIDTNIVIRVITADDPDQTPIASALLPGGVFISHTVLMETEWVLRSYYRWERIAIAEAFDDLLQLEGVYVLHETSLSWALDRFRMGADWADMLHLLAARGTESFQTFDRSVVREAGDEPPLPIEVVS
jgi:predicted nucleic-acid-binding protein